jgi:hypothetical protein
VNATDIPDQSFEPPAAPQLGQSWPKATLTAYPMKPTDTLCPTGQSGRRHSVNSRQPARAARSDQVGRGSMGCGEGTRAGRRRHGEC